MPIVYFVGTRPNWYRPIYPTFVERDEPAALRVLLGFGRMRGPYDEREPVHISDEIERRYVVRSVKQRIHQAQFRGAVLPAYQDRCAICRLREVRLLDAAHIVGDADEAGAPVISNGLSLCSLHHRAFDEDLVGLRQTFTSTSRAACWRTRTVRCSLSCRDFTEVRSSSRLDEPGGQT